MKILICTLIATLFLASCSQQRYSGISKVKHPKKNEETVSSKEPLKVEVLTNKQAEMFDVNSNVQNPKVEKIALITPIKGNVETPKRALKMAFKKSNFSKIFTIPLYPKAYETQLQFNERKLQAHQHHISDTQASRGWFYYIVVGIIFLLLASLFAEGSLLSAIFAIVGFIAIIFGLLALIDVV